MCTKKIVSNFLEKWEMERIYFNGSLIINSLVFWYISAISKHSCTVQVPVLARRASEKVPCCAKTVTLRSAGDLFGFVSCIPSRFSRLWKWMFAILMADFCMHLFTHLNLSYMLLREWKAIIFFFPWKSGLFHAPWFLLKNPAQKLGNTCLTICVRRNHSYRDRFFSPSTYVSWLRVIGNKCIDQENTLLRKENTCWQVPKGKYLNTVFTCDINVPALITSQIQLCKP